jgi:hypothetical protein
MVLTSSVSFLIYLLPLGEVDESLYCYKSSIDLLVKFKFVHSVHKRAAYLWSFKVLKLRLPETSVLHKAFGYIVYGLSTRYRVT